MTILIPLVILGALMTALGYYFATNEGKLQQAKPTDGNQGARLPKPLRTEPDPGAAGAEQPMRGVPLHQ